MLGKDLLLAVAEVSILASLRHRSFRAYALLTGRRGQYYARTYLHFFGAKLATHLHAQHETDYQTHRSIMDVNNLAAYTHTKHAHCTRNNYYYYTIVVVVVVVVS